MEPRPLEKQVLRVGQMFNHAYEPDGETKFHLIIRIDRIHMSVELTTLWNGARWIWRQDEILRLQAKGYLQVF